MVGWKLENTFISLDMLLIKLNEYSLLFYRVQDRRSQIWFLVPHSARWMGIRLDFVCTLFVAISTFTGVFSTTDAGKVKLLASYSFSLFNKLGTKLREDKIANRASSY